MVHLVLLVFPQLQFGDELKVINDIALNGCAMNYGVIYNVYLLAISFITSIFVFYLH